MKFILFAALAASAQQPSAQQPAGEMAAPAVHGAYHNNESDRQLKQLEQEEKGAPDVKAIAPEVVNEPRVTNFTSHGVSVRFLFLKIGGAVLRFHVDPNLGDKQLDIISKGLGESCLRAPGDDMSCDTMKRSSIAVDRAFFSDIDVSKVDRWSRAVKPTGLWKLVCASGGEECFDPTPNAIRQFKITTSRSARDHRVLAHGFESQVSVAKRRTPASTGPKMFDRVYVTRSSKQVQPQLPVGTL